MSHIILKALVQFRITECPASRLSVACTQNRLYARYKENFREPIYHPKDQEKLLPEELIELTHEQFKAAWPHQNASFFYDPLLSKFTNHVMRDGRKKKARQIIFAAFEKIKMKQIRAYHLAKSSEEKKSIKTDPLAIFHEAINNCKPLLDIDEVKRGGVLYKVPIAIPDHKAFFKSMKWMIEAARDEPGRTREDPHFHGEHFADRLARELVNASNNTGRVIKKKLEYHKIAEANKAYAHFRWT